MKPYERILFIRTDRMGDVLMNLPAIRTLRRSYPKAWMALALDRSLKGLLDGHPDLDELMYIDAFALKNSRRERLRFYRTLIAARFDLAIASNPEKWLHALLFFARIPERVGWRRKWGFLLTRAIAQEKTGCHETESNLKLVAGIAKQGWDRLWEMPRSDAAEKKVNDLLENESSLKEIVAIHPATSHPAKRWDPARFAEVSDHLSGQGYLTVLIGGAEEKSVSKAVAGNCLLAPLDLTGALDLAELAAFLRHRRVRLLVSCDSGPVHVAWVQGLPVVSIYSTDSDGSNPERWGPLDGKSEILHAKPARLDARDVIAAAEKVLAKN